VGESPGHQICRNISEFDLATISKRILLKERGTITRSKSQFVPFLPLQKNKGKNKPTQQPVYLALVHQALTSSSGSARFFRLTPHRSCGCHLFMLLSRRASNTGQVSYSFLISTSLSCKSYDTSLLCQSPFHTLEFPSAIN
jgi:hypothetical protein